MTKRTSSLESRRRKRAREKRSNMVKEPDRAELRKAYEPPIDNSDPRRVPVNFCNLRHTNEEFIIFVGMSGVEQSAPAHIDTALVMSPYTAKRLWVSLGTILANWEQSFGEIEVEAKNRTIAQRPAPIEEPPAQPQPHMPPATPPAPPTPTFQRQFAPHVMETINDMPVGVPPPTTMQIEIPQSWHPPKGPQSAVGPTEPWMDVEPNEVPVIPTEPEPEPNNSPCIPAESIDREP